jgi:glyoxylase I family protein
MYRSDKDRAANQTPARGVRGVHHLTISVADVERASRFYGGVLGFEVEKPAETAAARWLHVGDTIIVLRAALPGTPESDRFSEYRIGVDHLALAVDSREDLLALLDALAGASIPTRGSNVTPYCQPNSSASGTQTTCSGSSGVTSSSSLGQIRRTDGGRGQGTRQLLEDSPAL